MSTSATEETLSVQLLNKKVEKFQVSTGYDTPVLESQTKVFVEFRNGNHRYMSDFCSSDCMSLGFNGVSFGDLANWILTRMKKASNAGRLLCLTEVDDSTPLVVEFEPKPKSVFHIVFCPIAQNQSGDAVHHQWLVACKILAHWLKNSTEEKRKLQALTESERESKKARTHLEQRIHQLRAELERKNKAGADVLEALKKEKERAQKEIEALRNWQGKKILEVENEKQTIRAKVAEMEERVRGMEAEQKREAEAARSKESSLLRKLDVERKRAEKEEKERESLKLQNVDFSRKVDELETCCRKLQQELVAEKTLNKGLLGFQEEKKLMQAKISRIEEKMVAMEAEKKLELDDAKYRESVLIKDLEKERLRVVAESKGTEVLRAENNALKDEVESLKNKCEQLDHDMVQLTEQSRRHQETSENALESRQVLQDTMAELKAVAEGIVAEKKEMENIKSERNVLKGEMRKLELEVVHKEKIVEALTEALLHKRKSAIENDYANLRNRTADVHAIEGYGSSGCSGGIIATALSSTVMNVFAALSFVFLAFYICRFFLADLSL